MDRRIISDDYTEIGHELIETEPELNELKESGLTIIFLASEDEKKKAQISQLVRERRTDLRPVRKGF